MNPMRDKEKDAAREKAFGNRPRTWHRLRRLFSQAIEINTARRAGWLKEECAGDSKLGREAISLLNHHDSQDPFLEHPAWSLATESRMEPDQEEGASELPPGTVIGSWQMLRRISSGGMGTVYLAERALDAGESSKQLAAIKVMRRRVDPELFAVRFRRERRILAQLNHPFIARFLEGGTHENGLPYFVLDYVDGEPINHYCTNHRLDLRAILELFSKVCSAVACAHRNLIIHRDLKPSNILVTADGTPRLIDFGIAKFLVNEEDASLRDQTIGIGPCTPRYSSPEQIRGETVTTATDVFALGIILYELVTGAHPFCSSSETEPCSPFELLRRICEGNPGRLVEGRESAIPKSRRVDLEAVILKALQKQPNDRYKSVEYFADDIQNFLDCRPVAARPESWWYRTRRLLQRHPTASLATSVAFAVGVVALGLILASDRVARRERDYALQQRELAASTARAVISDLASTLETMSAPVERRLEMLNQAVQVFDRIDSTSRNGFDPGQSAVQLRAEVQTQLILARALEEMGDPKAAIHRIELAAAKAGKLLASQPSDPANELVLAKVLLEKCRACSKTNDAVTATEVLEQASNRLRALERLSLPDDLQQSLDVLLCDSLVLKVSMGDPLVNPAASANLLTKATAYGEKAYKARPSDPGVVDSYSTSLEASGSFYFNRADRGLFLDSVKKALALRRDAAANAPGDIRLQRGWERAVGRWGCLLAFVDPTNENQTLPEESVTIVRKLYAADPNNVDLAQELIHQLQTEGAFALDRGRYQDAARLFEETIDIAKRMSREKNASSLVSRTVCDAGFDLFDCYFKLGNFDAAKRVDVELLVPLTQELEKQGSNRPGDRLCKAGFYIAHGEVVAESGDLKKARDLFSRALSLIQQNLGVRDFPPEKACYGEALAEFGRVLWRGGELELGIEYIERGLRTMHAYRDNGMILLPGFSAEVSEAENDLRRYQEEMRNLGAN
jgi:serine/threonine protein kinase